MERSSSVPTFLAITQHHSHGFTNIANLSGKTDRKDNDLDEGTFFATVISSKNNKQSSNGHAILPLSTSLVEDLLDLNWMLCLSTAQVPVTLQSRENFQKRQQKPWI
eukprot:8756803-Ditylum_brightwellii.AAC.1